MEKERTPFPPHLILKLTLELLYFLLLTAYYVKKIFVVNSVRNGYFLFTRHKNTLSFQKNKKGEYLRILHISFSCKDTRHVIFTDRLYC